MRFSSTRRRDSCSCRCPRPALAQEWIEYVSKEDRFTGNFPGQPKVTQTTYTVAVRRRSAGARLQRRAGEEPLLADRGRLQPD